MSKIGFAGFPRELPRFLKELQANNHRDWFQENKWRYEEFVLAPALEFISAIQAPLKKLTPHFLAVPKRTGGSLMRIYRDTRFSKEKTPYKTNVGIHFRHEVGKDVHAPGFYFHIDPKEIFLGAGIWHPANPVLNQIRAAIDDDPARWKRARNAKAFTKTFRLEGDTLKRPPRGYDEEHPLIEDLKRKDHIGVAALAKKDIHSPEIVSQVITRFQASKAYMRFLCDALHLPF